jgi:hypothetical protein
VLRFVAVLPFLCSTQPRRGIRDSVERPPFSVPDAPISLLVRGGGAAWRKRIGGPLSFLPALLPFVRCKAWGLRRALGGHAHPR